MRKMKLSRELAQASRNHEVPRIKNYAQPKAVSFFKKPWISVPKLIIRAKIKYLIKPYVGDNPRPNDVIELVDKRLAAHGELGAQNGRG